MRSRYFTKPIVKAINEVYFRKYTRIRTLKEINGAVPSIDLTTYKVHLVNNEIKNLNLRNLLDDLSSVLANKLHNFKSVLGENLKRRTDSSYTEVMNKLDEHKHQRVELLTVLKDGFSDVDKLLLTTILPQIVDNIELRKTILKWLRW